MIPYKTKAEIMVDSECKRYFNFDGVMAGVLYLLHKHMHDYYQMRNYDDIYREYDYRCCEEGFVRVLNNELISASNHQLKVDKLVDIEMKNINGKPQRVLLEIEIQNNYQPYYWQRGCDYLCRVRSEYANDMKKMYPKSWVPTISCWFITKSKSQYHSYVDFETFEYCNQNEKHLMLALVTFQYSNKPPETNDEIELAFYKLLSPFSSKEERLAGSRVLNCNITKEEAERMCGYSEVCIELGREEGIEKGVEICVSSLLKSMSIEEVYVALNKEIPIERIIQIKNMQSRI